MDSRRALTQAEIHLANGELDKALRVVDDAISSGNRDPRLYLAKSLVLIHLGMFDGAREAIDMVDSMTPDGMGVSAMRGRLLVCSGKFREALPHLDKAKRMNPDDLSLYVLSGNAYSELGRHEAARKEYLEGAAKSQHPVSFLGTAAMELALQGNLDGAISEARTLVAKHPESSLAHFSLARVLVQAEMHRESIDAFQAAKRLDPENTFISCDFAHALLELEREAEGLDMANDAIQRDPGNGHLYNIAGLCLYAMGRHQEALDSFREAMERGIDDPKIHFSVVDTLFDLGMFQEAYEEVERYLDVDPENDDSLIYKGIILRQLGRYEESIKAIKYAIRATDAPKSQLHYYLAETFRMMGRHQEALESNNMAISLDPQNPALFSDRGQTYMNLGRYWEASKDFDRATRLD